MKISKVGTTAAGHRPDHRRGGPAQRAAAPGKAGSAVGKAGPAPRKAGPVPRRRAAEAGSRDRLLAAASAEFAAHGFAGASVDRIARAARANKAMIYYHFASKAALYREIAGDMFHAVGARVREVDASGATPEVKVAGFIEAIADEAEARPHFPAIWFREIAEGGAHLDVATLREVAAILDVLVSILHAGVKAGRFRRVHPIILHSGIIGPIMLFFATARLRARLERAGVGGAAGVTREALVAHVQSVTLSALRRTES
jgi:AcrR family transcriptional regulator